MHFTIRADQPPGQFTLKYVKADHALSYEGSAGADSVSLLLDTLQLVTHIDSGRVVGLWGYFPSASWRGGALERPRASGGGLHVTFDREVHAGEAFEIPSSRSWSRTYDSGSGWLRVGAPRAPNNVAYVEFLGDVIAGVRDGALVEIWMHPEFV